MAYSPTPLSIRFDSTTRRALERAARADDRPVSALVRKIVADWLARKPAEKRASP